MEKPTSLPASTTKRLKVAMALSGSTSPQWPSLLAYCAAPVSSFRLGPGSSIPPAPPSDEMWLPFHLRPVTDLRLRILRPPARLPSRSCLLLLPRSRDQQPSSSSKRHDAASLPPQASQRQTSRPPLCTNLRLPRRPSPSSSQSSADLPSRTSPASTMLLPPVEIPFKID